MKYIKDNGRIYCIALAVFFVFLIIFRFHNALSFNPYWGYDGGGHLDYIFSLAYHNTLPDLHTDYLAWHEPLYYFLMAGMLKIILFFKYFEPDSTLKILSVIQAILSLATTFLVWRLISALSKNKVVIFSSLVLVSLWPSFNQASTFVTNELLNYFFIFLICFYFIKKFLLVSVPTNYRQYIVLGVLMGLALLTKITAVIPVAIIFGYLAVQAFRLTEKKRMILGIVSVVLTIVLLNAPLFVYRAVHKYDLLSVNNTDFLQPQSLRLDGRVSFFTNVDLDIFEYPYWYAGGQSFWTMLYADSAYDYYGSTENRDQIAYFAKNYPDQLSQTTIAPTYVTQKHLGYAKVMLWVSIPLFLMIIAGWMLQVWQYWKERKHLGYMVGVVPVSFLAAAIYFAYRYPYYEYGVVKSIFIGPAFLFLIVPALEYFYTKNKALFYCLMPIVVVYVVLLVLYYWIPSFNY